MRPINSVIANDGYCRTCEARNVTHLVYVDDPADWSAYVAFNLPCGHYDTHQTNKFGISTVLTPDEHALALLMAEGT